MRGCTCSSPVFKAYREPAKPGGHGSTMQLKLGHSSLRGCRREDAHCHILQAAVQALRALSPPIPCGISSWEDKGR